MRTIKFWAAKLQRLLRHQRVCYCCGTQGVIDGAGAGDLFAETVEHMLLTCTHPDLVQLRTHFRSALTVIAGAASSSLGFDCPDFDNDTVLWTVYMLCGGIGPVEHLPLLQPIPRSSADSPSFDAGMARSAARWVGDLTSRWVEYLRSSRYDISAVDTMPGGLLVNEVVASVSRLLSVRRKFVQASAAYRVRSRDLLAMRVSRLRQQAYVYAVRKKKKKKTSVDPSSGSYEVKKKKAFVGPLHGPQERARRQVKPAVRVTPAVQVVLAQLV